MAEGGINEVETGGRSWWVMQLVDLEVQKMK